MNMQNDDAGREMPPQDFPCELVAVPVWTLDFLFEDIKRPWAGTTVGLWVRLYRARHKHEPWAEAPNPRMLAGMAGISVAAAQEYIREYDAPLPGVIDPTKVKW
jgi:hypothetical protein